jgi:A/G-specific adenine glycosylase
MQPALTNRQARALLHWGQPRLRDLPWRHTRDPWAVLVSETMLQQTQVARVIPKYVAFLDDFPTPAACAARPVGDVVRHWVGLGYNRRAVNLHRAAVVAAERGSFPDTLAELLALPGVGPYTARAVLAFAFEHDVAVVDTNIARVLARLPNRSLGRAEVQASADVLVPPGEGWAWNQVIMEFGALVCTARSPACNGCPVRNACGWKGSGPDPAIGSAGVSGGQSRFSGSDRQGRGRLVSQLRDGSVTDRQLAQVMGWPDDAERAARVAATLVRDGLAMRVGDAYALPS